MVFFAAVAQQNLAMIEVVKSNFDFDIDKTDYMLVMNLASEVEKVGIDDLCVVDMMDRKDLADEEGREIDNRTLVAGFYNDNSYLAQGSFPDTKPNYY